MGIRSTCILVATLAIALSRTALALPNTVLGNFNQPSSGVYEPISSLDLVAVPFVTDDQYLQLDGVEINAVTLLSPGNIFVQIWDMDAFGQPSSVVGTLSGPTEPAGFTQYTGSIGLQAETSYFLVIGAANGAGSIGTAVFAIDGNQVDSQPTPIYQIGTDFDGDGSINFVNKCLGSGVGPSWNCGGAIATRFFPEFRLIAEIPSPPVYSLTSAPLALDFGVVAQGSTSAPLEAEITNDGTEPQTIEPISVGVGFALAASDDGCSGMTLQPGENCSIFITFSPQHGGVTAGTAIIPTESDPRSPYGLVLTGESDQPGTVIPPSTSTEPRAVPLRFTLLTALALMIVAAIRHRRCDID